MRLQTTGTSSGSRGGPKSSIWPATTTTRTSRAITATRPAAAPSTSERIKLFVNICTSRSSVHRPFIHCAVTLLRPPPWPWLALPHGARPASGQADSFVRRKCSSPRARWCCLARSASLPLPDISRAASGSAVRATQALSRCCAPYRRNKVVRHAHA